ncbi:MAG: 4Fe-4S binding protein, partial [Candidatus Helarchaeota archaeon]|nr:4Fe-4S binding protein [Candidatus Helarchaeota archaeon]
IYEEVRQKLAIGRIRTPKHEKVSELMKVFWNEEAIKVLAQFPKAGKVISIKELVKKTGMPKAEIRAILKDAVKRHTIAKIGARYGLVPLLPGVFEGYFIAKTDNEENLKKAGVLYRFLIKNFSELSSQRKDVREILKKTSVTTPLLPYEAQERLIKIDETVEIEKQVVSMEFVKDMIDKSDRFGVITCPCRLVGEMSGEPCEVAPAEMGCFVVGIFAEMAVQGGIARPLTKVEAIDYLKKTEEAGLVHNAMGVARDRVYTICNCCKCHCGALLPASQTKLELKLVSQSNYTPKRDQELCILCEKCMDMCPMEAISHPAGEDDLIFNSGFCIGCGICAANCPENAISMVKVRDVPPRSFENMPREEGELSFRELFQAIIAGG